MTTCYGVYIGMSYNVRKVGRWLDASHCLAIDCQAPAKHMASGHHAGAKQHQAYRNHKT